MEKGNILVIAPEGTRSLTAALAEGKLGASYLAAKLNRPIIPAGIAGSEDKAVGNNLKHFRRSPILVTVGKLFSLPPLPMKDRDAALKQFTDEIMCHIAAELPEKYRGVYAEHPRFERIADSRFSSINSLEVSIQFQIVFLNAQAHIKSVDFSFSFDQVGFMPLECS